MTLAFRIFFGLAFSLVCFAQNAQDVPRFTYQVWGTVRDENSRTMSHVTVCFLPVERPINGRIPCTKTSDAGTFSLTVNDIPDKYNVCASTTETPSILVGDTDPNHRVVCSKAMEFGAHNVFRKANLKFETKKKRP
jgi:hypothetical protein